MSQSDDNVTILLRSWPTDAVPATDLMALYFPACTVTRALDKDIKIISMSGTTRILDLLRSDDSIRVVGTWLNDDQDSLYDGLTSFDRHDLLYELCTKTEVYGVFTWSAGPYSETQYVMPHDFNCDQEPGNVGMFTYNFLWAVLNKEPAA